MTAHSPTADAEELAALGEVHAALEREQAALRTRDAEALITASGRKSAAIDRAARLAQARRERARISGDEGPGRPSAEARELAARCRALNEINGALIRAQRRRLTESLQVLRGGAPAAEIYGRGGETHATHTSRGTLSRC